MMLFSRSLRLRLLSLILMPLITVAVLAIGWQYKQSLLSAESVFDQKLSIMALAIFRDLVATNGENLSPATKLLFEEAAGASFFYHVRGPDGSFVTGYSPPPFNAKSVLPPLNELTFFESTHRGRAVKVVQIRQLATIDELSGEVLVSVWQDLGQRTKFATRLALQVVIVALLLLLTTSLVVFFGVRMGLRPLKSLEDAIQQRSGSDLRPIKRDVPIEVRQIVRRLNQLFDDVNAAQSEKDRFISNAAHQLRNPIAAIRSMAEVVQSSKTLLSAKQRNNALIGASRNLSRLTEQLLSYEALKQRDLKRQPFVLDLAIEMILRRQAPGLIQHGLDFSFAGGCGDQLIHADEMLIEQAMVNLIDNATKHGGDHLSKISVTTSHDDAMFKINVLNDGAMIAPHLHDRIFERFEQGHEAEGSGLGLAIVKEICLLHGGEASYSEVGGWACFTLTLPQSGMRE